MRIHLHLLASCVGFLNAVVGQGQATSTLSGIYRTADEFKDGTPYLAVDCRTAKHKIKLHDFLNKSYLDVIHQGTKTRFQKAEVFGLQECGGKAYRFFDGEEYLIREVRSVVVYEKLVTQPGLSGKGTVRVPKLFFSTALEAPVQLLTKANLKRAFPDRHALHDRLDTQFASEDATDYDAFHRMYRINHLLQSPP